MSEIQKEQNEKARREGKKAPTMSVCFKKFSNSDKRRYNIPTVSEISAIFSDEDGVPPFDREFMVYSKNNQERCLKILNILSQHTDPMVYPIFFPNGEPGWDPYLIHNPERR